MKAIQILILTCTLLFSCSRGKSESATTASEEIVLSENSDDIGYKNLASTKELHNQNVDPQKQETEKQQNKIIRTGSISIESKEIALSKKLLDELVKKIGGYYEQENSSTNTNYTSFDLTIRVPNDKFEKFITEIETGKDKVTNKSIRSEDVSLQYYDLESRLKSKRIYLERYQNMVSSAKSVKELLEIEEQIRQLQEDIESTTSTLRNLSGQVNYSTLQINLFEYQANLPLGTNSFAARIKDSFAFGAALIETIVLGIIGIWPILIIITTSIFIWIRLKRKQKN